MVAQNFRSEVLSEAFRRFAAGNEGRPPSFINVNQVIKLMEAVKEEDKGNYASMHWLSGLFKAISFGLITDTIYKHYIAWWLENLFIWAPLHFLVAHFITPG